MIGEDWEKRGAKDNLHWKKNNENSSSNAKKNNKNASSNARKKSCVRHKGDERKESFNKRLNILRIYCVMM